MPIKEDAGRKIVPRQLPDPGSGGAEVFFFVRLPAGPADLRGAPVLRLIPLEARRLRAGDSSSAAGDVKLNSVDSGCVWTGSSGGANVGCGSDSAAGTCSSTSYGTAACSTPAGSSTGGMGAR